MYYSKVDCNLNINMEKYMSKYILKHFNRNKK